MNLWLVFTNRKSGRTDIIQFVHIGLQIFTYLYQQVKILSLQYDILLIFANSQ